MQGHTNYQWIYASVAGWLSPITKSLQSEHSSLGYPLSNSTISLCASVTAISSAITVPLYSYLVDKYGRKWIIFAITIPQADAYKTVAFLRGVKTDDKVVVNEIDEMQKQEEEFRSLSKIGMRTITFAILTYASAILSSTGNVFDISPQLQTISFPIVMIIASLSLTGVAERFGRRQHGHVVPSWLPITSMMVAVAMYAGSVRPLPSIISTEIIVTYGWVIVATQLFAYGPLTDTCGLHVTFICYGVINSLGVILCYIMPETKGRTDQEIRQALAHPKTKTVRKPT
ncbi:unnamed protein product [Leptidea sinapis]|uniref:Major facilitator superfamily (MFS) profile domain-containing protein n=1 Tax=Leptidea sinapis TaxID=189913 RepID=A0A5E4QSD8_9NEOP|nr:unnamed protein product [Leptidea sinapis]